MITTPSASNAMAFAGDFEVSDERVVKSFGGGAIVLDVAACPSDTELTALCCEFGDDEVCALR